MRVKPLYNPQNKRKYKIKDGIGFFRKIRDYDLEGKTKPILTCRCKAQTCYGKYLKMKSWQKHCAWEEIRLGHATDTSLNDNIYDKTD